MHAHLAVQFARGIALTLQLALPRVRRLQVLCGFAEQYLNASQRAVRTRNHDRYVQCSRSGISHAKPGVMRL